MCEVSVRCPLCEGEITESSETACASSTFGRALAWMCPHCGADVHLTAVAVNRLQGVLNS